MAAPSAVPLTIEPHLLVLIRSRPDDSGAGVLEVEFTRPSAPGPPIARNVSPFTVEPGKFTYRLVRAELEFDDYATIEAACRIDRGPWHVVPLTLLPPS